MTLDEKFHMWNVQGWADSGVDEMGGVGDQWQDGEYSRDDDDLDDLEPHLNATRSFITDSVEYQWLVSRLNNLMDMDCVDDSVMYTVTNLIITHFESEKACTAHFAVDWDIRGFVKEQRLEDSMDFNLKNLVTLTSSESITSTTAVMQATTCEQYANAVWPHNSENLLRVLQALIDNEFNQSVSCKSVDSNEQPNCPY